MKRQPLSKKKKIISRKTIRIEWGDCDPAQIVYFPRYFAYFDACTTALFLKAGLPAKRKMLKDLSNHRNSTRSTCERPLWRHRGCRTLCSRRVRDHRVASQQFLHLSQIV